MWPGDERHDFDPISLTLGLILIGVATIALAVGDFHIRWVLPGLLIALGLVGLAGALRRPPRQPGSDQSR
ncbi:MAG: hypothetical protein ACJ735_01460 [Actinomycetes bacterium]